MFLQDIAHRVMKLLENQFLVFYPCHEIIIYYYHNIKSPFFMDSMSMDERN